MEEKLVKSILLATANAFAPPEKLGRPRTDHGLLIDTFIRVLRTGMPWREVRDVDFRTAHRHFILWARGGIFEKTYRRLLALCNRRKRDGTFLAIDTTFVKNVFGTDVLGRNPTDRGRKASKVVAVVDERGLPHRLGFLPANVSDYKVLHSVLPLPKSEKGLKVYADKGFDSEAIRKVIMDAGFEPRIPKRGSPSPLPAPSTPCALSAIPGGPTPTLLLPSARWSPTRARGGRWWRWTPDGIEGRDVNHRAESSSEARRAFRRCCP